MYQELSKFIGSIRKVCIGSSFNECLHNPLFQFFLLCSPRITSVQYCGGCSILWGIASVHVGDSISTVGNSISTVGDSISTAEAVQYCGGKLQYMWGESISTCGGIASVHVEG